MKLPPRLYSLDAARGFAAFSVVIWHWQHFFFDQPGQLSETFVREKQPFYELLSPFYNHGGGNAVAFFFLLSGFVFFWLYGQSIADRSCSFKAFWLARFSRLYPLHLITLLIVLALQNVYHSLQSEYFVYGSNDLYHFILHLFFASHWGFENGPSFNGPVWSVSIEIGLYMAFFALAFSRKANVWSVSVLVGLLVVGPKLGLTNIRWTRPLESFLTGGLVYYFLSIYLATSWRSRLTDIAAVAAPIAIWVSLGVSGSFADLVLEHFSLLTRVVFPLTVVGLVLLESRTTLPFRRLKWIGDCTYSSYLLHFPLQIAAAIVALEFSTNREIFYSPWSLLAFLFVLGPLSLATYKFCEKPLQKATRSIGQRLLQLDSNRRNNLHYK